MRAARSSVVIPVVALTASLAVGAPAPEAQTGPGDLVFSSPRRGNFEIFRVRADGSAQPVNLSRNTAQNLDPAWSPDGTLVAFARTRPAQRAAHLFVMSPDGELTGPVTSGPATDRQPAWGPDGNRIAFVRSAPPLGTSRLFLVNADGRNLRRLVGTGHGVVNTAPSWSPDGTRIAFSSDRNDRVPQIYAIRPDGTGTRRLTTNDRIDTNPAWSPDGTRIAFERCCRDGASEIFVMNANGTGQVNLTRSEVNEAEPAWSPDGQRIAFVAFPRNGGNRNIWTMSADGSDRVRITWSERADLSPHWRSGAGPATAGGVQTGPEDEGFEPRATSEVREVLGVVGGGPGRIRRRATRVAPGVRLIRRVHLLGPKRVFALEVDPTGTPSLDVGLARDRLLGVERTRRIARRHGALAAVNGDFSLPNGRPAHAFARDGDLKQSSFNSGPSFAVVPDGRRVFLRQPATAVRVREPSGDRWDAGRWNFGTPVHAEPGVYTVAGAGLERPPRGACAARLRPVGPLRWGPGRRGVERDHEVGTVGCFRRWMRLNGGVVIAARPGSPEALLIRSLVPGSTVSLGWSLGFSDVLDSLGGYPMLVRGGRGVVGACGESLCARHPRTAIGVKGNGRILLMVVDGRRPGWSVGMTLSELAGEMRQMGARRAMNLDGGGSSTMVVRRRIINRPSDGSPRAVSSALMVLRGPDRGEPWPSPPASGALARVGLLDPGSTGGLLEAAAAGTFGPRAQLPPDLIEALRVFRQAGR